MWAVLHLISTSFIYLLIFWHLFNLTQQIPSFCIVIFVANSVEYFHLEALTRFRDIVFKWIYCVVRRIHDRFHIITRHMWSCVRWSHVKNQKTSQTIAVILFWFEFNHNGQPQYHHLFIFLKKMLERYFKRWATSNKSLSESIIWNWYNSQCE